MPPLTHAHDADLVVFHIGMTIRAPHRPDLWLPVLTAMPRMLKELGQQPELGLLGSDLLFGRQGPWVVQYWRSVEDLHAYAHDREASHLPAWKAFNRAARQHPDAVGIWHETYLVPASGIETLYANGALVGLGKHTGTVPAEKRGTTAPERLSR